MRPMSKLNLPTTSGLVFPLPLTAMERYFVCDDRDGYPMSFAIWVDTSGVPDRGAFENAFAKSVRQHPMLTARLHRGRRCWMAGGDPPSVEWIEGLPSAEILDQPIDLQTSNGVVARAFVDSQRTVFAFQFHHAVCDGLGGLEFIGDVLTGYAELGGGAPQSGGMVQPAGAEIEPNLLRFRGEFDLTLPHPVSSWQVLKSMCAEGGKIFLRRPVTVAGMRQGSPKRSQRLPVTFLSPQVYGNIRQKALRLGTTTNDLLLTAMFVTLREWNTETHGKDQRGWLRINLPTSLRGRRDLAMPATNLLGYALITRHMCDCRDAADLLPTIANETQFIRDWSSGAMFVQAVATLETVPGLLPAAVRINRQFATLVLSNLGDPQRRFRTRLPEQDGRITSGNLVIDAIYGVPPIRPGTRMSMMLSTYGGGLAIALNADPRWFDDAMIDAFINLYCSHLEP
jgi:hypothetical protein